MKRVRATKGAILVAGVLFVMTVLLVLFGIDVRLKRKYRIALEQRSEMAALAEQYRAMRSHVDRIERRIGLSKTENIPVTIENVLAGVGLKKKLKSVKPFGGGTRERYEIQEAEIVIDKLTLNELVNVLHAFSTVPSGIFVTSAEFKRDFSERNLINARMSLKLIGLKPEAKP